MSIFGFHFNSLSAFLEFPNNVSTSKGLKSATKCANKKEERQTLTMSNMRA